MGAVYWLQATRWRRIADTRLGQRRFVEMVVAGVAVNNVLPGRVGDLLRARWVSRERSPSVAGSRRSCSTVASTSSRSSPSCSQPPPRDRRGLGRPHRRRIAAGARRARRPARRGALVHAPQAPLAPRTSRAAAALRARHARGPLGSALRRARPGVVRAQCRRLGGVGRGGDPGRAGRRGRALPDRRTLRDRGAQPRGRDPVLTRVSSARTSGSASRRSRSSASTGRQVWRSRS